MTTVVSTLNMKGGVGKTTLTYNLAWYACKKGYKVLVVDLDPQSNITLLFLHDDGYGEFIQQQRLSVADIFENPIRMPGEVILPIEEEGDDGGLIDLLPSRLELSETLKNPTTKERRLARFLAAVKREYDLVLIDCPPTDSILTIAGYQASDYIVVPVVPERLATIGLPLLARSLNDFNDFNDGEHRVRVAGIVFNEVDSSEEAEQSLSQESVRGFAQKYGWKVFEHEVRNSRSYLKGTRQGKPIFMTPNARESVMQEFYKVGDEFLESVGIK
ncbi:ParA family protein [Tumebacillus permanentifrigoris]|uniref:Chromosome partitioning protein n=1 Tax=Tumebacillus permanentifrigoris TaxID=378543 RepID=A0A316DCI2_9BACL|nr:ParA family protein [Tumebacillus permanentifrigoris]PWK15655.1 chromosome partitioning protein [Tumebacillus permanentifrigoris]